MTATCEVCRAKPASVRDFALRAGRFVPADVCEDCMRRQRRAPLAILGITAAAAALVGGAAFAIDAVNRRNNPGGSPSPGSSSQPLSAFGKVFGPAATTLAQYSRDLTEAARKNALDPVIGHAHSDADRPAIGELAQTRRILHAQCDAGVETLPDPRHGEESAIPRLRLRAGGPA